MTIPSTPTVTATEVVLPGRVEPHGLQIRQRELSAPTAGQALIRVAATGISFAEQQMRRGKYYDQPPFPFVPGYDIVGRVSAVGPGVDPSLIGQRVAALTKTGGWATHMLLDADDLVAVPDGLPDAAAETLVVNGITAWQMLHRVAQTRSGQTIVVHGANGGVGSTLVQLAHTAGINVIGTASQRHARAVETLGARWVDYHADVPTQVREMAPRGVAAVFDHIGGPGIVDSFRLLAPGGTLVSYGTASTKNDQGNSRLPVLQLLARLALWNALPNRRKAHFFNLWAGKRNATAFRERLTGDLSTVLEMAASGKLQAQVAAQLPLTEVVRAVELAESRTVVGKVVLIP